MMGARAREQRSLFVFQSSPGPRAGRYPGSVNADTILTQFQSSPGPRAGRYYLGAAGQA